MLTLAPILTAAVLMLAAVLYGPPNGGSLSTGGDATETHAEAPEWQSYTLIAITSERRHLAHPARPTGAWEGVGVFETVTPEPEAAVQAAPAPSGCLPEFGVVFGANAGLWCSVAWCESGMRVGAVNFNPSTGDDSHGLLQVNMIGALGPDRTAKLQGMGYNIASVEEAKVLLHTDAMANLRLAYLLSSGGVDFGPWSCQP